MVKIIIRFGYVAMSMYVADASPSKTMTVTNFEKLMDRQAAIRKLERLALENLHNTLRILRHNRAHDIKVYRFSSKLIPLIGHELLEGWNPIMDTLASPFAEIGKYVREHNMRTSFHPDHFTVLSTPRESVLRTSIEDLNRHVQMQEAMGLDEHAKCNIHIGGSYGDKGTSLLRFLDQFEQLEEKIKCRITLENDDKTYTAAETLLVCETLKIPMVLDIHHHQLNHSGEPLAELWSRIADTWILTELPPKIHVSSPKSVRDPKAHADYIEMEDFMSFIRLIAAQTPFLDVMLEAKMKDAALLKLMADLLPLPEVKQVDQAAIEISLLGD